MTEPKLFADLLAAQMEMPALQKSAINPHFKNRYVPLEELLQTVVPILNAHNFVLTQQPTHIAGAPALKYRLVHVSGEQIEDTMPLLCSKDDPQGQGSAITYARRYSLMSLLGLTADADDDAETTRKPPTQPSRPAARPQSNGPQPACPEHGAGMKLVPAGTSKAGKEYGAFWSCGNRDCQAGNNGRGFTIFDDKWQMDVHLAWRSEAQEAYDPGDVPFSE